MQPREFQDKSVFGRTHAIHFLTQRPIPSASAMFLPAFHRCPSPTWITLPDVIAATTAAARPPSQGYPVRQGRPSYNTQGPLRLGTLWSQEAFARRCQSLLAGAGARSQKSPCCRLTKPDKTDNYEPVSRDDFSQMGSSTRPTVLL